MKLKVITGVVLTMLLASMLTLAFNIQPVKASGTIYIRADGSVDPPTAPISSVDNVTYTFTGNINDEIVVERDNIVVDGAGYTLKGFGDIGDLKGIYLSGIYNVTIERTNIETFGNGIYINTSSYITVSGNKITENVDAGIYLWYSSNNSISGNNVTNNHMLGGILTVKSDDNTISNNTVTDNENYLGFGILLQYSKGNILRNNSMVRNKYNFGVWASDELSYFINDIDTSNTVDGKLVYYLVNQNNLTIDLLTYPNIGYLGLINSTEIVVKDLNLTSNHDGVLLAFTSNSTVENVTLVNNTIGIHLIGSHTLIRRNRIEGSKSVGIFLDSAKDNLIDGNNITNNVDGIFTWTTDHNTITRNNILNNYRGINFASGSSNNNLIYHNNFINNTKHVHVGFSVTNTLDNGYPSGGNYWSNYNGTDFYIGPYQNQTGSDGIGDTAYVIDANNQDRYPLMGPFNTFNAGTWNGVSYNVDVVSNSTVSDFYFNPDEGAFLRFNVTGSSGTIGFSRVAIPKQLLWVENGWVVFVGGEPVVPTVIEDTYYTYLYFTYSHSTKTVEIIGTNVIPEFPTWTSILLIFTVLTFAIAIYKRRLLKTPIH